MAERNERSRGDFSFNRGRPADNPPLIGLVVTVIVSFLLRVRRRLEALVEAVYFRARRAHQRHLEAFGRELTQAAELDGVVDAIKQVLSDALAPSHVYVYLSRADTRLYVAHGSPRPEGDICFDLDGSVAHVLARQRKPLRLPPDGPLPPELITDSARLRVLEVEVLAGLKGQERLAGFIALGPKRSGRRYVFGDLRFVEDLADQAALAVERAQVISDLERRVSELNVLSRISQAVNFTFEFGDLLELVYAQASDLLDTTNFFIALHDPAADELYYALYVQEDERISEREGKRWRLGRGLLSEVVRSGQPIRTDDYVAECAKRDVRPREHGLHAWMGVPLNAGGSTLGAMAVASTTPGFAYTDEQLGVFWIIADTAATAIDKSRLFTETERRAHQLAALNQISTRMAQVLDVEELLRLIVSSAVDILQTESGSLLLTEPETGDLEFRVATGPAGQLLVGTRLPRGTGVVGAVAERGEPVIVNDVRQDPRWFPGIDQDTDFRTEALLAAPLSTHDDVIGVLEVINKRDGSIFGDEDVQLLTTFAAQAAIAIENARLFQQTDAALAERMEELKMLARIDRELNSGLEIDRIVGLTLDWAMRVSGANAGVIGSVEPERGLVSMVHYGCGPEAEESLAKSLPLEGGILGRVIQTGTPELVNNISLDPDNLPLSPDTRAELVVPLRAGGEVVGVIILESYNPSTLTQGDMEFVVRLAEHASPAIANARLFADLKAANEAKSDFVSVVSHELKTPMTSIKGFADLLMQGAVGEVSTGQLQFLSTIRSNVDRMGTLVSDLADITRIEAGQIRLEVSPIEVRAVIEDTLRGTRNLIEAKNQDLQVLLPEGLPLIQADHMRLVQVMTNLVSNAHKYTSEGGAIIIGAEMRENNWDPEGPSPIVHIYVKDDGIGMSLEDRDRLFQKFFRSENPQTRQMPGTGLGLSITKNLVELHGGRIWAESELGAGSTFHFTIPVAGSG
jgi:signal transduction histidine kinase